MGEVRESNPVAASFSRAASSYDKAAQLQQWTGLQLLRQLPAGFQPQSWLDLGCGTGFFTRRLAAAFPGAQAHALDIAQGMLQHARQLHPQALYLCGDAQALPLASASLDLIFSNLALQWCPDMPGVLAEARRVLRPGGLLAFTSLAQGSLYELERSWQAVDEHRHVNSFRAFEDYRQLCRDSALLLQCEQVQQHFPSVSALSRNLRQLGAAHLQEGRSGRLTSRQQYQRLCQTYEGYRQPAGLPASWQVVFVVLQNQTEARP